MMAASRARAGRLAVWSGFLALTLRLLHGATFGHLTVPLGSVDELVAWADRTSPTVMAFAAVRLLALVAAWYLTIATILAVVADIAGWRRLAAVVAALSPGIVSRVAARAAGVGLAAGAVLAVAPLPSRLLAAPASASAGVSVSAQPGGHPPSPHAATEPAGSPTATMTQVPAPSPSRATMTQVAVGPFPPREQETASMTRLPGTGTSSVATMRQIAWSSEPSPPATSEPGTGTDDWTVSAGDSFWSIAEEILTETTGRPPTDADVGHYWRQLIEANRSRLADPANPDLLIPGQRLAIPTPAPA